MKIKNVKIGETYKVKPVEKRKEIFGSNRIAGIVTVIGYKDHSVLVEHNGHDLTWIPAQWLKRNKENV